MITQTHPVDLAFLEAPAQVLIDSSTLLTAAKALVLFRFRLVSLIQLVSSRRYRFLLLLIEPLPVSILELYGTMPHMQMRHIDQMITMF